MTGIERAWVREMIRAAKELLAALSKVQDWEGTRTGDAMDVLESLIPVEMEEEP